VISLREFLGLVQLSDCDSQLPIADRMTAGNPRSLFGGVGLAAGILALEGATGRRVVWATGQYVARVGPGSLMDIHVDLPAVGRGVTQGRVQSRVGDREIITVVGATSSRQTIVPRSFAHCPSAPHPDECEAVVEESDRESVHDHADLRLIRGMHGFTGVGAPSSDGRTQFWIRMPGIAHDAAALALMADYMSSAVGNALARIAHCTSLDNTIRFATPMEPTDNAWILCDNHIEFVADGLAHGTGLMWSSTGSLLATASQSMSVRFPRDRDPSLRPPPVDQLLQGDHDEAAR